MEQGFSDSPGLRLFYFKGEVGILAVSQEHEVFSGVIALLLGTYFVEKEIAFTPTGSSTQEKEGKASAEADQSYLIGTASGGMADLSIEVVFTSGNESKLHRYQALGLPEVWFWQEGVFGLYHLRSHGYEQIDQSEILPDLDINLLSRCLLIASRVEAVKEWRRGISGD
ncbi:Uma2 family endonuclease [Microcoleus sp. T3_A4]|uniref:Uma2 family endonuclease n=1 Tax=Microcoleus sp. T3_A4 TaxID=2818968 RepID=UPI002FD50625